MLQGVPSVKNVAKLLRSTLATVVLVIFIPANVRTLRQLLLGRNLQDEKKTKNLKNGGRREIVRNGKN